MNPEPAPDAAVDAVEDERPQTRALARPGRNPGLANAHEMRQLVDATVEVIEGIATIGSFMLKSGFCPPGIDTNEKAGILAMTALEMGVTLPQATRFIDVIEGRPFLRANLKRALINSRGPGRIVIVKRTPEAVTARGIRPGFPTIDVTYSLEDAKRAQLLHKKAWQQNPIDMMVARATSRVADLQWPEIIAGMGTAEDGGAIAEDEDPGGTVDYIEGEFAVVDDVDPDAQARADAILNSHGTASAPAGRARPGNAGPSRKPFPTELPALMTAAGVTTADLALVVFDDGRRKADPHARPGGDDIDRWIFEGEGRTLESLVAAAAAAKGAKG